MGALQSLGLPYRMPNLPNSAWLLLRNLMCVSIMGICTFVHIHTYIYIEGIRDS